MKALKDGIPFAFFARKAFRGRWFGKLVTFLELWTSESNNIKLTNPKQTFFVRRLSSINCAILTNLAPTHSLTFD